MSTVVDDVREAALGLLLEEYEKATDLHDWIGPEGCSLPFYFELERWHRAVEQESFRLVVSWQLPPQDAEWAERYLASGGPPKARYESTRADISDPDFAGLVIEWLRELRGSDPKVSLMPGDVVRLKSGGFAIQVSDEFSGVLTPPGLLFCRWQSADGVSRTAWYPEPCLDKIDSELLAQT